jgi:hypothetical protein
LAESKRVSRGEKKKNLMLRLKIKTFPRLMQRQPSADVKKTYTAELADFGTFWFECGTPAD